jgi:hypothetical protein
MANNQEMYQRSTHCLKISTPNASIQFNIQSWSSKARSGASNGSESVMDKSKSRNYEHLLHRGKKQQMYRLHEELKLGQKAPPPNKGLSMDHSMINRRLFRPRANPSS